MTTHEETHDYTDASACNVCATLDINGSVQLMCVHACNGQQVSAQHSACRTCSLGLAGRGCMTALEGGCAGAAVRWEG
jgi:hypothetical protein